MNTCQRDTRPNKLLELILKASELEALGEFRERLLDLIQFPLQLFSVHIETMSGGASQCRASLQLTEGGRNLATALGAVEIDLLAVEEAIRHPDFSCVWKRGEKTESQNIGICSATRHTCSMGAV